MYSIRICPGISSEKLDSWGNSFLGGEGARSRAAFVGLSGKSDVARGGGIEKPGCFSQQRRGFPPLIQGCRFACLMALPLR